LGKTFALEFQEIQLFLAKNWTGNVRKIIVNAYFKRQIPETANVHRFNSIYNLFNKLLMH
jgi:hypothetical protein